MVLILCIIMIPVALLIYQTISYVNQYNDVLENLEYINYIVEETDEQGERILSYCSVNQKVSDTKETETIVRMQDYIEKIRNNIGTGKTYEANQESLDVVENLLTSYANDYKDALSLCGDHFSLAGDVKFYSFLDTEWKEMCCSISLPGYLP